LKLFQIVFKEGKICLNINSAIIVFKSSFAILDKSIIEFCFIILLKSIFVFKEKRKELPKLKELFIRFCYFMFVHDYFLVIFEIYKSISAHLLLLEWIKSVLFIVILIILIGYRILKRIIPKKNVKEEKLE
jgi:hypothetical protein